MYLFLGGDISVREDSIIGVFDMDNTTVAASTRKFLSRAQKEGRVVTVSYELPKSFCLTSEGKKKRFIYRKFLPLRLKSAAIHLF